MSRRNSVKCVSMQKDQEASLQENTDYKGRTVIRRKTVHLFNEVNCVRLNRAVRIISTSVEDDEEDKEG